MSKKRIISPMVLKVVDTLPMEMDAFKAFLATITRRSGRYFYDLKQRQVIDIKGNQVHLGTYGKDIIKNRARYTVINGDSIKTPTMNIDKRVNQTLEVLRFFNEHRGTENYSECIEYLATLIPVPQKAISNQLARDLITRDGLHCALTAAGDARLQSYLNKPDVAVTLAPQKRKRGRPKKNAFTSTYKPEQQTDLFQKSNEAEAALDSMARLLKKNDEYRDLLHQIAHLITQALKD